MLKGMNKKYIYMLGVLIAIPVLLILFLMILKGCSSSSTGYSDYQKKMISAAEKYFKNKGSLPITEGGTVTVYLDELVKNGYISSAEKKLKDTSCTGSVSVRNNGASLESNNGGYYLYIPYLECNNYKSEYIIDKLKNDIVTEKSGLYEVSDGYVYKGAKVNNYVSFFKKTYRILSIDNNGVMKLVKVENEKNRVNWDSKYNIEKKQIAGLNDYSDSNIVDVLLDNYKKMPDDQKKHILAYNACYGNRSLTYTSIDKSYECSKILENQFVGIMNTYDYASASYDNNCTGINSPSCRNYNYLYNTLDTTWLMNGSADNTYDVYYYEHGKVDVIKANNNKKINIVIYVDGNELYSKGDGTESDPYIINN